MSTGHQRAGSDVHADRLVLAPPVAAADGRRAHAVLDHDLGCRLRRILRRVRLLVLLLLVLLRRVRLTLRRPVLRRVLLHLVSGRRRVGGLARRGRVPGLCGWIFAVRRVATEGRLFGRV
ncbi:hypothetical protein [Actinoplanes utahensis]|uniref:hypothetical protein n=1 Tax=Actinoplanes utahensis TaxID=1869 RepID=UPI00137904BD|nr:hypothetical protein [Actinoplanes utahensis]